MVDAAPQEDVKSLPGEQFFLHTLKYIGGSHAEEVQEETSCH